VLTEVMPSKMVSLQAEETRRLVQRVVNLPTLPIIIPRILRLVEDPRSSANDLAGVIGTDQSLASRILRLANSAFYGFRREITSINHAVVLLGFETVKSIVLAATVHNALIDGEGASSFDRQEFWRHVVATATAAKIVARDLRRTDTEVAFVNGLLHDMGKVVLDRFLYRRYAEAARLALELPCAIREAEVALFGVNHAEVGGWLAERWNLPLTIIAPVSCHHQPDMAAPEYWEVSAIVQLADILARNAGIGSGGDKLIPLPDVEVLRRLGVGPDRLLHWTEALTAERQAVEIFHREIR
jgi:putative nucleotidyltransferase with HDIG domain